ncbi:MAG TPA: AAA family ATPase [Thermoanaerobaculia bacterium]|nr:AAA family ATPase [Thermoanaerobaculia bacterium]
MILRIPERSLVVLVGPSGAGKSTFARRHFRPTEVLSSDALRAWVSDDENDQSATGDAFEILHDVAARRLARRRLTVVDATSLKPESRQPLIGLARRYHARPVAIVFDLPEPVLEERNRRRADRQVAPYVLDKQLGQLRRFLRSLASEGFRQDVWILRSPEEVEAVRIERLPARPDRRPLTPPAPEPSGAGPRWPAYRPAARALPEPSRRPGLLEHPDEVFAHFRAGGTERVVCEEMLGGVRAVVVVCRDEEEARRRFGGDGKMLGTAWTRSGPPPFEKFPALERAFLGRLRDVLDRTGFWERHGTGWACLEGELTPWSLQAGDLARRFAAVGAAARVAGPKAMARLAEAGARGLDVRELLARYRQRYELSVRFVEAYRRRCRQVRSVADLRFAPFHLVETEGAVLLGEDPVWHLEILAEVCRAGPELLVALPYRRVSLGDAASEAEAARWWEEKTEAGGEGMVVKPLSPTAPAMLCRGREALRLVHGPEYTLPESLERLRALPR